jgi:hypothetical protein
VEEVVGKRAEARGSTGEFGATRERAAGAELSRGGNSLAVARATAAGGR